MYSLTYMSDYLMLSFKLHNVKVHFKFAGLQGTL